MHPLDRLSRMSTPPCELCGATTLAIISKNPHYECPSCKSSMSLNEGLCNLLHLQYTPAYHGKLVIDPAVISHFYRDL